MVRVTHWLTVICFFALLISGGEIVISHPRFYWGETGQCDDSAAVHAADPGVEDYGSDRLRLCDAEDQNGWSRSLHFQAAWAVVLTGLVYAICESVERATFGRTWFRRGRIGSWRALWG